MNKLLDKKIINLENKIAKLEKSNEEKTEFISIAAHQLRTPLTVIKGYVSMFLENDFGKISKEQKNALEMVAESTSRLIDLVENLLSISRIDSGRIKYNMQKTDLTEIINSVVTELKDKAKNKNIELEKKLIKATPQINIDPEKIRQVIMNLVDNAIKYTPIGKIKISLQKEAKNLLFCVADNGLGISNEDLPNLFQKFSRGTGNSLVQIEGTGLGLYVAKQMIEAHKGKIWAESEGAGKGAQFYFMLPL